jgi:hypothetical protein
MTPSATLPSAPAPSPRRLTALRLASVLQFLGALPALLVFIVSVLSGDSVLALGWSCAPLALAMAIPLWLRQRWAWWVSILLAGWYPLAPLFDLAFTESTAQGGEDFFLLTSGTSLLAALFLGCLLWFGRGAVQPASRPLQPVVLH